MPKTFAQLEFRFPSWLRKPKPSPKIEAQGSAGLLYDPGLTAWCQETAASLGLPELARKVRVSWNPRMRTTAGRAWWPHRSIEMNPKLREIADAQVWRTLKHELAHLVAYERNVRRRIDAHGQEWRAACADLGIPDETTYHTLPLKSRRMKRNHSYACPHCLAVVNRVRPFRRVVACYTCCRKFSGGAYDNRFRLIKNAV